VIASSCPTLVEIGRDAALFCDPHKPEEFAAAMIRIVGNAELRSDLRARGIERAGQFSWDRSAAGTLAAYEKLLVPFSATTGSRRARGKSPMARIYLDAWGMKGEPNGVGRYCRELIRC